jgi:UDPglucose--hexose-1-phosphate uridylyltransferase
VRVVPNLYPAFERQEVVIHTPRHARSFADLDAGEVELVADAWQLRAQAARHEDFAYVHALINEGRDAGASLPHSHSQLVWLREPPPAVTDERAARVPELLARGELRVAEEDGVAVLSHPAGRGPYEFVVAPLDGEDDAFSSKRLGTALRVLAGAVARLRNVEGGVPWNAWLHTGSHWHLEVLPRLAVFAGIELGAGIYVNTLAPEEAAERLRNAAP